MMYSQCSSSHPEPRTHWDRAPQPAAAAGPPAGPGSARRYQAQPLGPARLPLIGGTSGARMRSVAGTVTSDADSQQRVNGP